MFQIKNYRNKLIKYYQLINFKNLLIYYLGIFFFLIILQKYIFKSVLNFFKFNKDLEKINSIILNSNSKIINKPISINNHNDNINLQSENINSHPDNTSLEQENIDLRDKSKYLGYQILLDTMSEYIDEYPNDLKFENFLKVMWPSDYDILMKSKNKIEGFSRDYKNWEDIFNLMIPNY